jgi:hypothetical protein
MKQSMPGGTVAELASGAKSGRDGHRRRPLSPLWRSRLGRLLSFLGNGRTFGRARGFGRIGRATSRTPRTLAHEPDPSSSYADIRARASGRAGVSSWGANSAAARPRGLLGRDRIVRVIDIRSGREPDEDPVLVVETV